MPFHIGPWEIGLVLVIILIIFGVGKLTQVGGAIGRGLRSFRKAQRGEEDEEEEPKATRTVTKKAAENSTKKEK